MNKIAFETPLGLLTAYADNDGIYALCYPESKLPASILKEKLVNGENKHLHALQTQINEYFTGKRKKFELPLFLTGTDFQQQTWQGIRQIPFGQTKSYKELAALIELPKAARAIANACGANNLPIIIPCHRITSSDGTLGGYHGGMWRKKWLLDLEAQ